MSSGLGKARLGKAAPHVAPGTQVIQTQGIQGPPGRQSVHLSVHSAREAERQEPEGRTLKRIVERKPAPRARGRAAFLDGPRQLPAPSARAAAAPAFGDEGFVSPWETRSSTPRRGSAVCPRSLRSDEPVLLGACGFAQDQQEGHSFPGSDGRRPAPPTTEGRERSAVTA